MSRLGTAGSGNHRCLDSRRHCPPMIHTVRAGLGSLSALVRRWVLLIICSAVPTASAGAATCREAQPSLGDWLDISCSGPWTRQVSTRNTAFGDTDLTFRSLLGTPTFGKGMVKGQGVRATSMDHFRFPTEWFSPGLVTQPSRCFAAERLARSGCPS